MDGGMCRYCGRLVKWVTSPKGKKLALEPAPLQIVTDEGFTVRGRESHVPYCPRLRDALVARQYEAERVRREAEA